VTQLSRVIEVLIYLLILVAAAGYLFFDDVVGLLESSKKFFQGLIDYTA
jgi:hypothetical protein